jgi:dienelactone hydrolase
MPRINKLLIIILILVTGILFSRTIYARDYSHTLLSNGAKGQKITIPSKQPDGAGIEIAAYWFAASPDAQTLSRKLPAIVLMHGCGGPYNARGELTHRMREYTTMLTAEGYHALVIDSLSARGEKELCTQRLGSRRVTQAHRQMDALSALQWLALRPEVDAQRLVLMGWSNGGSSVLAATNQERRAVSVAPIRPRAAVAFYPGCKDELKRGYQPTAPLLMMVGALDDWTPPASCQALYEQQAQSADHDTPRIVIETMKGAYHGFDGADAVRVRQDVPNGVKPGAGVHVGGNAEARELSRSILKQFLKQELLGG